MSINYYVGPLQIFQFSNLKYSYRAFIFQVTNKDENA